MKTSLIGIISNIIIKLTKDVPSGFGGVLLSCCSALIMLNTVPILGESRKIIFILYYYILYLYISFVSAKIKYYETNISGLLCHVYIFTAIETFLSHIWLLHRSLIDFGPITMTISLIFVFVMWTFFVMLRKPGKKGSWKRIEIILPLKIVVCTALTVVYYLDTFSLSNDPEVLLMGLYFNSFYFIYTKLKNNSEETEEQINNPEEPTGPTLLTTDPTSETERDILPTYEESFNYPNSEFKNNKNVDNIDKTEIDGLDGGSCIKMYKIQR